MTPKTIEETEEHRLPPSAPTVQGEAALIVAFPEPKALPLPESGKPVGRDWLADHGLTDAKVSRDHFAITRNGGALQITDTGSRNGTWVDGHPLQRNQRIPLREGALVRVGRTLLVPRMDLLGGLEPAQSIGALVGPYGLRSVAQLIAGFKRQAPRNVMIEGETGTGKELVARAIADVLRPNKPYAPVNVAGVAAGVFESQFFGYVRGAYSGSGGGSPGIVQRHDGGTVFLDEIGELPIELQSKFLRLLDNREVLPVGADRPSTVDVLIVGATNRSLEDMVAQGSFRRDLYARFAAAQLQLPALCERREDIFAIARALCQRAGADLDPAQVDVEAAERLLLHAWPANVRELDAILMQAWRLDPLPALRLATVQQLLPQTVSAPAPLTPETVRAALDSCQGNQSQAARQLKVNRGQLLRFMKANGLA